MIANTTSIVAVLVALVAAVFAVPSPVPADNPAAAAPAAAMAAVTADTTPAENPLRTIQQEDACRPGLCPHIRQLVPDLSHAPPHFLHAGLARSEFVGEPSLCGNLCVHDRTCPSHQKCCPTTCGYACQDTVFIHEEEYD